MKQSRRGKNYSRDESHLNDDNDEYGPKTILKPDDQLTLTDADLKEEITRILTANNPHAPQNIVRFNFKENTFKPIPNIDQTATSLWLEGSLLHKDSDDAKRQIAGDSYIEDEGLEEEKVTKPDKKLANQFNFCERSSQTFNNALRERGNVTEPPPRANFSALANQWIIYDDYLNDFERQQLEKGEDKKNLQTANSKISSSKIGKRSQTNDQSNGLDLKTLDKVVRIVERMVNQNSYDDIAQDFRYYEDQADEFKDQVGTLLPLWKFNSHRGKKLSVTCICWSPCYQDLFAVGYGSYDFTRQGGGMVAFFSLKNPDYPEYFFTSRAGVLCVDIHPQMSDMFCAGFYDGAVAVYSIKQTKQAPLFVSTAKTGKHNEPVWDIRWIPSTPESKTLNFISISSDGRVTSWIVIKDAIRLYNKSDIRNELTFYDILTLKLPESVKLSDNNVDKRFATYDNGTCIDFHPSMQHIFLVGTEEGYIHRCSSAYKSEYLFTYKAHHRAVYRIRWSPFHSDLFISCASDWSVKIWDQNKPSPIFVYDLSSPVNDVTWAPYSSTVFAACTSDGKVHIFDLNVNKYESLCCQIVVEKSRKRLTHLAFNQRHPVILVGDDKGTITSLKLSPNLRKMPKEKKGAEPMKPFEMEMQKIEKILQTVS